MLMIAPASGAPLAASVILPEREPVPDCAQAHVSVRERLSKLTKKRRNSPGNELTVEMGFIWVLMLVT